MEGHEFLISLAIIYIAARIGGLIAKKINQPTVLGEMIVGIIIGPSILNIIQMNEILNVFSEIGVILLMFIAGLETDVNELRNSGKSFTIIATGGVIVPFVFGYFVCRLLGYDSFTEAGFVGLVLTATSVSISVQTLRELKQLRSKQGISIMGAAIIDDVIGIILLALFLGITTGQSDVGITIWHIILYFILVLIFGALFKIIVNKFGFSMNISGSMTIIGLVICFLLAYYAEKAEVATITGAYLAGLIFSTTSYRSKVSNNMEIMAYLVFTPIFFVGIGMKTQIRGMDLNSLWFVLIIFLVAMLSKIIGCGVGSRIMGFSNKRALQIGVGMASRGEVALIITTIGYKQGILSDSLFSLLIFAVMLTSLITPILLKIAFKGEKPADEAEYSLDDEFLNEA
jgi:Kef-type K+ transport system membrane component KefB